MGTTSRRTALLIATAAAGLLILLCATALDGQGLNYDEAMQYLNLNYRRKADLACGDDNARKADLAKADEWVQKATGARKINEAEKEKKASGGVDMTK